MRNETFTARSAALFWQKVDQGYGPDQCWLWGGQRNGKHYGIVSRRGRRVLAHRFAYALANGPIAGLLLSARAEDPRSPQWLKDVVPTMGLAAVAVMLCAFGAWMW